MMNISIGRRLCCLAGVLLLAGCGDDGPTLPEGPTGTVSGKVTYNGAAVPEGSVVTFHPVDQGVVATGTVDAAGQYELTSRQEPRVLAGTYKVTVSPPTTDSGTVDEEAMRAVYEGGEPPPPPLPEKFASPQTSGLEFTVKEGPNGIDIPLKD